MGPQGTVGRRGRLGGNSTPGDVKLPPKLGPCPSTGLQSCQKISYLHICLKYNEEFDKALKEVTTNNYKNSKE